MNATDRHTAARRFWARGFTLREKLFLGSALISTAILLAAAWVINRQVVAQARQQVQAEVEDVMALYDAVWDENARSLERLGATVAASPVVKAVFGDPRAAGDRATLREMFADAGGELTPRVDLTLVADGAGRVTFAEMHGGEAPDVGELAAARAVAEDKAQRHGFALIGGRLFQLALTPVLIQSGGEDRSALAVIGTGTELNREAAAQARQRVRSEVVFLAAQTDSDRLYASSLEPSAEPDASRVLAASAVSRADGARPVEVELGGETHLAFSRQLADFDSRRVGQVVVLRSLANAGRLFGSISNLLLVLWTISIAAAFALSYFIAGRITRPLESLVESVREFSRGNYDREITARRHGELRELAAAFDQMRRSLKQTQAELLRSERLATVGRMAGSIVHDLRNPLATLTTAAEMLSRDGLAADRRETLIASQLRAAERMNAMLGELLAFARGNYQLRLERLSLADIVARAERGVNAHLAHANVVIESSVAPDLFVRADAERLRRVFENLLANAVEAMPQGGRVQVSASTNGDAGRVRVDVIDTGGGVPEEMRERLFEPFVSHGKLGGTGLGLAIAKGLVEAHGGRIGLEAAGAPGADFYVELPLDEEVGSRKSEVGRKK
jgi:signal transduction histidine kinase